MKSRIAAVFALTMLFAGCASFQPSVPEGYTGPVATIRDSAGSLSSNKADLFYVAKVDDRTVRDSQTETISRNQGRGFSMTPAVLDHDVPARPTTLSLVGVTHYAAPILALTNPAYKVEGTIQFTPEPKKIYVVRGSLGADKSSVWLEEDGTGVVLGKVESQPKK